MKSNTLPYQEIMLSIKISFPISFKAKKYMEQVLDMATIVYWDLYKDLFAIPIGLIN